MVRLSTYPQRYPQPSLARPIMEANGNEKTVFAIMPGFRIGPSSKAVGDRNTPPVPPARARGRANCHSASSIRRAMDLRYQPAASTSPDRPPCFHALRLPLGVHGLVQPRILHLSSNCPLLGAVRAIRDGRNWVGCGHAFAMTAQHHGDAAAGWLLRAVTAPAGTTLCLLRGKPCNSH